MDRQHDQPAGPAGQESNGKPPLQETARMPPRPAVPFYGPWPLPPPFVPGSTAEGHLRDIRNALMILAVCVAVWTLIGVADILGHALGK